MRDRAIGEMNTGIFWGSKSSEITEYWWNPSDSSVERVLNLAWEVSPKGIRKILVDEPSTFDKAIST